MTHYILYGHGGSANHGCEALVRTTTELMNYNENRITLVSSRPENDLKYGIDKYCEIVGRNSTRTNAKRGIKFIKAYLSYRLSHDITHVNNYFDAHAYSARRGDIAVAIGGDSYCYGEWLTNELIRQHKLFKSRGLKTVFWGCSIEPELLNDDSFVQDMKAFDLITARESITYEALKAVNPNTILVADSAFALKKMEQPLPEGFSDCDLVGINTSPLIEKREAIAGVARKNYEELISTILDETEFKIMLIPHVAWENNDDRVIHRELFERFKGSGRIAAIDDCNCMELKGYISRCRFFIGARTHATIAAYSSGVPTLVVGYSTKSRGIARDLFGTEENYVLPVQELRTENDLADHWRWLRANEYSIRTRLQDVLPQYCQRINRGREALDKLNG